MNKSMISVENQRIYGIDRRLPKSSRIQKSHSSDRCTSPSSFPEGHPETLIDATAIVVDLTRTVPEHDMAVMTTMLFS